MPVLDLEQFQNPEFQGYVENVPERREYILSKHLPVKTTKDRQFSYNVVNGVYAKMASITGFNASAPLRDKKQLERVYGEIAKIQDSFLLEEDEMFRFAKPRDDEERDGVIEYVYENTDDLVEAVRSTEEFMRAQALYNGALQYDDYKNDVHLSVDFGVPSDNKMTVTKAWSDPTSTPLTDIQAALEQYREANNQQDPIEMHLNRVTLQYLLRNEQIRNQLYGNNNVQQLMTRADIDAVFAALDFPPIVVNNDVVVLEDENLQPVTRKLLSDNKVVFLGTGLGNTMVGPTAEKNWESGIFVKTKITEDPPAEQVRVGETAFPALVRPQSIVILSV